MPNDHTLEHEDDGRDPLDRSADMPSTGRAEERSGSGRLRDRLRELGTLSQHQITGLRTRSAAALGRLRSLPQVADLTDPASRGRLVIATGVIAAMGLAAYGAGQPDQFADRGIAAVTSAELADRDRAGFSASRSLDRKPAKPARAPRPTAGYGQVEMENAQAIVEAGQELGVPRRALVIAVATAMQESNLLNRASEVLPESKNYKHQGTGWDHDSVGLFQQRTSTGWGPVKDLMDPKYAATQFYKALLQVPGWEQMALTDAAQRVQVSAFPYHYAKHEGNAEAVVSEILAAQRGEH